MKYPTSHCQDSDACTTSIIGIEESISEPAQELTPFSMECVQKIQKTFKRYIKDLNNGIIPETESTKLTSTEALKEFIFLGLRKTEGININEPPPYVPPCQGGT